MSCLKCGRDIEEGQVFCTGCREVMEKYPGLAVEVSVTPVTREHGPMYSHKRHIVGEKCL